MILSQQLSVCLRLRFPDCCYLFALPLGISSNFSAPKGDVTENSISHISPGRKKHLWEASQNTDSFKSKKKKRKNIYLSCKANFVKTLYASICIIWFLHHHNLQRVTLKASLFFFLSREPGSSLQHLSTLPLGKAGSLNLDARSPAPSRTLTF